MLEIKGELVFKTVAYHRAADVIERSPVDLVAAYRAGKPPRLPGRGPRHQRQDRRTREDRPDGLLRPDRDRDPARPHGRHPDPGRRAEDRPPAARRARDRLHRRARRGGRRPGASRRSAGLSGKTEAQILAGIARIETRSSRLLLDRAAELVEGQLSLLAMAPGVVALTPAGSFRRRRDSIGDLDILAETPDAAAILDRFVGQSATEEVLGRGSYKAAIRLRGGPQVDLMIVPPGAGRDVRHPLHRLQGAQRPAPRDGPRPGLEPVREGLPAHRRGRRAAHRRRGRTEDVRDRGRGLRVRRPAVHRTGAARGGGRVRGRPCRHAAEPHHPGRPAGRPAQPLRVVRRRVPDRGHGRSRPAARLRLPGPDRPLPVADDRARAGAGSGGTAARDHRRPERPVRGRGGRRDRAARDAARGIPAVARLRARDPSGRPARLRRRSPGTVRPRRRIRPRRPPPVAGRTHGSDADRDPQPARRCHRPSVGPQDRDARRPRSRVGHGLRRGGPHRHGPRDERVPAAPGPGGRTGAARRRHGLPPVGRLRCPPHAASSTT